ncbi:lipoprotein NlpD [Alteromonadaceae bacterium 2753L.S.0a.02]|nr:lipoprotein NlpD [Alteromonadaceae bacterium 2753L.S.0a.02]
MFKILIAFIPIVLLQTACSSGNYRAPVSDRGTPPGERIRYHIVSKGETLYSIAWRYNLDYRELARANGVSTSYAIYPGQKLSLDTSRMPPVAPTPAPAKPKAQTATATNKDTGRSKNRSVVQTSTPIKKDLNQTQTWRWPATGKLIATFSSNGGLNKGIDIQGKLGEPVRAAAAGTVVYSGSGLRGYGKLIIVKHSAKYLSAYAHNQRLLVKEGDKVNSGDKIAEMGSTGTDSVKLHFEIRFDGNPVDPMRYLPRKQG